ncbi:phytoene dehydrogenase-like protein [Kitasatospora sp. MAP12-15]|uniref:phytoene desaturase family protein n=1 Tax=unclassified Kitasatospora TaxID=2633591 RepID=UPI002474A346|nr:NAD(P)/FAD-dependent oxidoreductase [Kitasatospora sp. MAP12-44]MDH6110020.1 phytoene dehydrogenase-like protein [Kitasatospora sp. MAP12-44]
MARIVIIGAGISGLAAAARLATIGHRVTVCEAAPTYGGMLGQYRRDGFAFDTGPTLLTLPAVYRDLALKTGKEPLEQLVELAPVAPESRHVFADGATVALPNASRGGVAQALDAAFGTGAGERWGQLTNRGRAVWEATRRPLLEEPLPADTTPLATDPYPAAPRRGLGRLLGGGAPTLAQVAARELGGHPALTALLEEYALRFGFDPRTVPAGATVIPYMEQSFGVWYVRGGMRALAEAFYRRCEQRGVEFRFDTRVEQPPTEDGLLLRTAPGDPALPGRFTVLLALRGARPAGVAHRTVVHAADRADELDALFGATARLCARPTVQVLRPDDASLRPDDAHETVTLTVTVPSQARLDWTAPGVADRYADQLLGHLEAAVPDLRERVLWRVVRTPADTERETSAPGGAVPRPALAGAHGAFLRTPNAEPTAGRYLIGGAAHPGGGLARAGMSACITAGLIGPA